MQRISELLLLLLAATLVPEVASLSIVSLFKEETLWRAKDILHLLLAESNNDRCSVILLTDRATAPSSIQQVWRSASYGGAHFQAWAAKGAKNLTESFISRMVVRARQVRLLSWCVTVVLVSDDPTSLVAFAEASDSGRLLVWEAKLLVVTRVAMTHLRRLLQNFWTFSMMNTMFLKLKNASLNRWQILVHLPYSPSGAQVVRVASWMPGHRLFFFKDRVAFPEKYSNFHGMKVNVTWLSLKPYWMEVKQQGPDGKEMVTYHGREYLLIQAMGAALNFTVNPLPYKGWDSVLGRVRTRESFMWPVNFPILPHMVKEYDFSLFLERSTLAFTMAKPSIKPSWQSIYQPLHIEVWISVAVTSVMVFIVLLIMEHTSNDDVPRVWLVMKQVLGTLLDEAIPGELPVRDATRVALTTWLIFSFIVGTVYRSNLTACLTVPKYPPRLENLAQLADSGAKITVVSVMELFYNSFMQSDSKVLKTIAERMVYVPTSKEGIGQALTEYSVHMRERLFMEVIIEDYYTNMDGSTDLYVTQESLLADFSAFVMIRDAPFKKKIDYCMLAFHTAGLIGKWKDNVMEVIRREGRQRRRKLEDEVEKISTAPVIKPLTMVHMQGPFFLYILCVIVSFVSFLGEVARAPFLRHNNENSYAYQ